MIKATIVNNINWEALIKRAQPLINNASAVIYTELTKYAIQFTPRLSGGLLESMREVKKGNRWVGIEYTVYYAKYVYYGLQSWNWTIQTHPNASPRWLHRAFDIYKKNIFALINKKNHAVGRL